MTEDFGRLLIPVGETPSDRLPVWRRITFQLAAVAAVASIFVLFAELATLAPDADVSRILTGVAVLSPPAVWLIVSASAERQSTKPRLRLIAVAVLSALVAAAVGLPVTQHFYRVNDWLPLESVFLRIAGYALTAGMVDAGLRLLVLRFTVYPHELRERSDAIAYSLASAIGYSTYLNLAIVIDLQPSLSVAASTVFANYTIQFASAMFIALGLVESYFSNALPYVMPVNVLIAAATTGLITPIFSGLMSGPLGISGSTDRPLFGMLFLVVVLLFSLASSYFLYGVSERREREAYVTGRTSDGT